MSSKKPRASNAHAEVLEKALVRGATEKNPQRYALLSDPPSEYIGGSPTYLNKLEFAVWDEMKLQLPWTKEADRVCFEFVVQVRARMIMLGDDWFTDKLMTKTLIPLMIRTVQHLGGSPVSRKAMALERGIPTFGERRAAGDYDPIAPYFS